MPRAKITLVLLIVVMTVACTLAPVDGVEKARVPSPDGLVDAVLIERATDATVATPTEIYITPTGKKPSPADLVLRADRIAGVELNWRATKVLEVGYQVGRIFSFTNFWQSKDLQNFEYIVEVRLNATSRQ